MSAERESRPAATKPGAAQVGAVKLRTVFSLAPDPADSPKPALIGASMEKPLDATMWRLVLGEIGLHELTPGLAAFYTLGHAAGVDSIAPQLAQAIADRDRYYMAAFNTGKPPIKIGPSYADLEKIRSEIYGGAK